MHIKWEDLQYLNILFHSIKVIFIQNKKSKLSFLNLPFLANFYKITGMSGTYYYYYYYDF